MTAFIFVGIVALLSGLMYLCTPGLLVRLSSLFNQIVSTDDKTMKYRVTMGIILIVLGLFFLFISYYLANTVRT